MKLKKLESINVFGKKLTPCCKNTQTGFYRNGFCDTCPEDLGMHTVCVLLTKQFLEFSKKAGNDLSTPRPEMNFPGLKPGERWCICARRWKEAKKNNVAPPLFLEATHKETLKIISLLDLQQFVMN